MSVRPLLAEGCNARWALTSMFVSPTGRKEEDEGGDREEESGGGGEEAEGGGQRGRGGPTLQVRQPPGLLSEGQPRSAEVGRC